MPLPTKSNHAPQAGASEPGRCSVCRGKAGEDGLGALIPWKDGHAHRLCMPAHMRRAAFRRLLPAPQEVSRD